MGVRQPPFQPQGSIMPYEVSLEPNGRYVSVRMYGTATPEEHFAARDQAADLCRTHSCRRLLVDLQDLLTTFSSTADCYEFGESQRKAFPGVRIANVLPTDTKSSGDVQFTVTVSANRGETVEIFTNMDDAIDWVLK